MVKVDEQQPTFSTGTGTHFVTHTFGSSEKAGSRTAAIVLESHAAAAPIQPETQSETNLQRQQPSQPGPSGQEAAQEQHVLEEAAADPAASLVLCKLCA